MDVHDNLHQHGCSKSRQKREVSTSICALYALITLGVICHLDQTFRRAEEDPSLTCSLSVSGSSRRQELSAQMWPWQHCYPQSP